MNNLASTGRLGFLPPGVELPEGLAQLGGSEGWLNGSGYVESVELRVATEGADAVTVLRGRFNLLSLAGPSTGPFTVTLARLSDAGLQVLGGELVRARSAGVNVTVQPAVRDAPVAAPPTSFTGDMGGRGGRERGGGRRPRRSRGAHPRSGRLGGALRFGRCEVLTANGNRLRIRDVDGARRVREVSLTMLRVTGPTESDGKRLFQLVRRGAA